MTADIWAARNYRRVTVATLGPDGAEDRFTVDVSRDVYALSRAQKLHAERQGCADEDVLVRQVSAEGVPAPPSREATP